MVTIETPRKIQVMLVSQNGTTVADFEAAINEAIKGVQVFPNAIQLVYNGNTLVALIPYIDE